MMNPPEDSGATNPVLPTMPVAPETDTHPVDEPLASQVLDLLDEAVRHENYRLVKAVQDARARIASARRILSALYNDLGSLDPDEQPQQPPQPLSQNDRNPLL